MQVKVLEALAEAVIKSTRYHDPSSKEYAARNPGALPATSPRHAKDDEGNRVFGSLLDGYRALLYDLEVKLSGKARFKLTPESTLEDLAAAYDKPAFIADIYSGFLRKALNDESITRKTSLKRFID